MWEIIGLVAIASGFVVLWYLVRRGNKLAKKVGLKKWYDIPK